MAKFQKIAITFLLFIFCFAGYAQYELNPFKYIIVPKQYDFLKKENQYRLNSLTKYLFKQEGFTVLYQGEVYPDDLNANPCLAVTADVLNESGAFTTKLFLVLKDCLDREVYKTTEGKSRIKEFEKTYSDALKKCFISIESLNYSFDESLVINAGATAAVAADKKAVNSEVQNIEEKEKSVNQVTTAAVVPEKNSNAATTSAVAIPVVITDKPKEESVTMEEEKTVLSDQKTSNAATTSAVAIPVVIADKPKEAKVAVEEEKVVLSDVKTEGTITSTGARAFKNETTKFLLIDQGAQMQAFVSESKNKNYKPGELIGTFKKTSLPNVFRVEWKKPLEGVESTTAYFDDNGHLKVDIQRNDKIEVLTFTEVK